MDFIKMGNFIAELRKEKNITQEKLGELLGGIDRRTISKWERGLSSPDIALLSPLAKTLDTSIEEIIQGEKISRKEKDNQDINIEAIKFYNKLYKNKITKIFLSIVIILICAFAFTLLRTDYYKYRIMNFSHDEQNSDFAISGTVIYNKEDFIINVNSLLYSDIYTGTTQEIKTDYVKITFYINDNILVSHILESDKGDKYINEFLESFHTNYVGKFNKNNTYKDLKNLKANVEYKDSENNSKIIEVKISVEN